MANPTTRDINAARSIGQRLENFRKSFQATCEGLQLPSDLSSLAHFESEELQNLILDLLSALRAIPDMRRLPSANRRKSLLSDLLALNAVVGSVDFNLADYMSLLEAILNEDSDQIIWDRIYATARVSTPPPKLPPLLDQTPSIRTTSSLVNSSGHRVYMDDILKEELGPIFVDIPGFDEAYFGGAKGLNKGATAVFSLCKTRARFSEEKGWLNWPLEAKEANVVNWLIAEVEILRSLASESNFTAEADRMFFAQPNRPLRGSTADRKLDVGFARRSNGQQKLHWSDVLVHGELKSNPNADTASKTWRDLGRYAREVLTTQDNRLFALGFSICGSIMRLWAFDRAGAIASSPFDVNKDGFRFVMSILAFLHMDNLQLGYDPTILTAPNGNRYIPIHRGEQEEHLIIDKLMRRASCVAGRATTCWLAHRDGDEKVPLVIKDTWQCPEREEEGRLLCEATDKGVENVARYYHHETVYIDGNIDNIHDNIRKGLDVTKAVNYQPQCSSPATNSVDTGSCSTIQCGRKRSSTYSTIALPGRKRTCSSSPSKDRPSLLNRVHRRVVIRDYGKPIQHARSPSDLLSALESCIIGYEALHTKTGLLQGDISTGNLLINDDEENPSWPAFLIDLDLAIQDDRQQSSGAGAKTGTRAFMAIGLLLGERHSFMHDLESFFWVLFWICIHYNGPNQSAVVPRFEKWNYVDMDELAGMKLGVVASEAIFLRIAADFTPFYKTLAPCVNQLRKEVFPADKPWENEDRALYRRFKSILRQAREQLLHTTPTGGLK